MMVYTNDNICVCHFPEIFDVKTVVLSNKFVLFKAKQCVLSTNLFLETIFCTNFTFE